jgi:hypothetical protein
LMSQVGARARVEVAEEFQAARRRAENYLKPAERRRKRARRTKAPCGECPIYLEHQKYKYRVLAWLSYPAAAAAIGIAAPHVRSGYQWSEAMLATWLSGMQVLPHALTDQPMQGWGWVSAENATILVLGLLAVSVILQLTEAAVFRLKL